MGKEAAERLQGGCRKATERLQRGYREAAGRLQGGCREAAERLRYISNITFLVSSNSCNDIDFIDMKYYMLSYFVVKKGFFQFDIIQIIKVVIFSWCLAS